MTLEKLKKMLSDGTITKSEYETLVEKLGLKEADKNDTKDNKAKDGNTTNDNKVNTGLTTEELQKLIQQSVDRATNKLGNENKVLKEQLAQLQREKLSADELKQLELQEKDKAIAEREKAVQLKEMQLYTMNAVKDAGLDVGLDSASTLNLVEMLMSDSKENTTARINQFKSLRDIAVKSSVDQRFKNSGRDDIRGSSNSNNSNSDDYAINFATQLGKEAAESDKAAQAGINSYIGGNSQ